MINNPPFIEYFSRIDIEEVPVIMKKGAYKTLGVSCMKI